MDILTYALCKKYIKKELSTIEDVLKLKGKVLSISELPYSGNRHGDVYLVGPDQENSYEEYYWNSDHQDWEPLGKTSFDVTDEVLRILGEVQMEYVKEGLLHNEPLTDNEQIAIEDWLGLADTYLTRYNTIPYTIQHDYNPIHKKYLDDKLGHIEDLLDIINGEVI